MGACWSRMGRVVGVAVMALLSLAAVAAGAAERAVYLKDGGVIGCQSFWKSNGKVMVLVNRDTLVELGKSEVDLQRTFGAERRKAISRVAKPVTVAPAEEAESPAAAARAGYSAPVATGMQPSPKPAGGPAPVVQPEAVKVQPAPTPSVPAPAPNPQPIPPMKVKIQPLPQQQGMPPEVAMALSLIGPGFFIGVLVFMLVLLASFWKVYEKAGEAGWKSLIPIYNLFILVKIAGKPWWWFLVLFVPVAGAIMMILLHLALAQRFGKGVLYGLGLTFFGFIFFPLLAFGKSDYQSA